MTRTQAKDAQSHVEPTSALAASVTRTQAKDALVQLGWKPKIAVAAVASAASALGEGATLERLIFEVLRRCPRPAS